MTTIILVVLGIILALFVALFMIFWGGNAFGDGQAKADAGRLVQESVQMEHAVDYYQAQNGGALPNNGVSGKAATDDLIAKKILTSVPPGAVTNASTDKSAKPSSWTIDYEDKMIYSDLGTDAYATKVCVMARQELHKSDPTAIPACSPTLGEDEPCCTKSS